MGKPGASDAQVEAVALAAGCDGFIRSLEQGYDTVVGGGGAHLSGGERAADCHCQGHVKGCAGGHFR